VVGLDRDFLSFATLHGRTGRGGTTMYEFGYLLAVARRAPARPHPDDARPAAP
jgi:hypothetical protein